MKKMEHCDMEGSPSRISRFKAVPLAGSTELRLQDALQTLSLEPGRLRFPLFLTALPQGCNSFCQNYLRFFFLQTVPVQSKRYHLSLSVQRVILQLHSQGKTDFLEEKEEDMECCGWLRDARYWEFPSSCLEIQGQREPLNAALSSVWLYLGSILKKFYQLVGSYIWYKKMYQVICPPQVSWVREKTQHMWVVVQGLSFTVAFPALQSYHCIVEDQPLSSTSPGKHYG